MWKKLGWLAKQWGGRFIAAPSVAGIVIALRMAGLLQPLELNALDELFRLRPPEPKDPRIVIVGIDESDIRLQGEWPISDRALARLLTKIGEQEPRAIGLDIYRDLKVEPGHEELVKVFESTPNLIGIKTIGQETKGFAVNPPPVLEKLGRVAANDLVLDPDSRIRRGLLFLEDQSGNAVTALAAILAFMYLEAEGINPQNAADNPENLQLGKAVFARFKENDGGYAGTYAQGYQILIDFRGPRGSFDTVSMTDVLENRIAPDFMRDRLVLIGAVAASLPDVFNTPFDGGLFAAPSRTPGVEVHANLTSYLIDVALGDRPVIQVWSEPIEWLWIFAWSLLGVAFAWFCPSPSVTAIAVFLGGGICFGGSYLAFLVGWWIPMVPSILALVGSSVAIVGYLVQVERQERQVVMNLFGRHVTPKIAEAIWQDRFQLIEQGELTPQEMTATVIFTDIKGFSTIAEQLEPKVLMPWLNEYMKAMVEAVLEHDGTIDKFIGDAVMAVFGVPIASTSPEEIEADAIAAVKCAVAMGAKLRSLNKQWRQRGLPAIAMRVGIATGSVMAGTLGSDRRLDYTIIGDTVNVAARLESFDKSLDGGVCRILISEKTHRHIKERFPTKAIGSVLLKGRQQEEEIYQVALE
ncbi:MAG: adenylate/guanylate cyclase domain-containing protein [Oscillatoria sp. SIO1A7]|nr:adenylate/guanylate cyclase domain-containing protein [Oscillatoria sp. SIO1A7]